jgi:hypothetical protein
VLVKRGDTVSVVDRDGTEVRGPISALSSSSLAIVMAGSQKSFLESEIDTIRQRRPDSLANGAKWGFGIGAGLDALVSSNQVIFARRGSAAKVTLRPVMKNDRTGVLASVVF